LWLSPASSSTLVCTLSLHDALPIFSRMVGRIPPAVGHALGRAGASGGGWTALRMTALVEQRHAAVRALLEEVDQIVALCQWVHRSEEHTSELQSRVDLVCRLLLEKK